MSVDSTAQPVHAPSQPVPYAPSVHKYLDFPPRKGIVSANIKPLHSMADSAAAASSSGSTSWLTGSICTPLAASIASDSGPTISLILKSITHFLNNPSSPLIYRISIPTPTFATLSPLLPERIKYCYTSSTSDLVIHKFPANSHEIGPLLLLNLYDAFKKDQPTYQSRILQELAGQIVWSMGTPSVKGHNGSERVADACVGRKKRLTPTVVVEVGWSQTLKSLREKAKQWLEMIKGIECVELVMCVHYERSSREVEDEGGANEQDGLQDGFNDREQRNQGEIQQQGPVSLELWRLCPPGSCRAISNPTRILSYPSSPRPNTRSTTRTAALPTPPPIPHLCQRLKIFPTPSSTKATFLLTDILGRDALKDDMGRFRWEVEMGLFWETVKTKKDMGYSETGRSTLRRVSASDILKEVREGAKENVVDVAMAGVLNELDNEEGEQTGQGRKRRKMGE
ncbi:hypothetical protein EV426DRAFT_703865 [Tirmania nivea]|nr:hypothetical protein EV426DRAFT_703865 [Tirmania nivea]